MADETPNKDSSISKNEIFEKLNLVHDNWKEQGLLESRRLTSSEQKAAVEPIKYIDREGNEQKIELIFKGELWVEASVLFKDTITGEVHYIPKILIPGGVEQISLWFKAEMTKMLETKKPAVSTYLENFQSYLEKYIQTYEVRGDHPKMLKQAKQELWRDYLAECREACRWPGKPEDSQESVKAARDLFKKNLEQKLREYIQMKKTTFQIRPR